MVKNKPQHLDMIQTEFSRRKEKNPRYSLRAFAQSLGMSTPTLSRILSGTQDISVTASRKIIRKLKLTESQTLSFISSVAEERCNKTYESLSMTFDAHEIRPHERNLFFISSLELKCLFVHAAIGKVASIPENEPMSRLMRRLGFSDKVSSDIEECIRETATSGKVRKYYLPFTTEAGELIIDSVFTPLVGKSGRIEAVASAVQNLNLESFSADYVSKR